MAKKLMKGSEAFGAAAINAGCRYYFGYPITPQNEVTEYMASELFKAGGQFIQAESEVAAINMAYGASAAGGRVMISSSSPGIALMQEGITYMAGAQLPVVLLNVARGGPGLGSIQPGQADYNQSTRGGGNGDYHVIVYGPASIQETVDIFGKAFAVADKYRNPVMILADGMMGQMMEPVELPAPVPAWTEEDMAKNRPWSVCGHQNKREHNVIKSLYLQPDELENYINSYWHKYAEAEEELQEWENVDLEDAELVFVAYGTTSRIVKEAMDDLRAEGIKTGLIRPISLWPFPVKAFAEIGPKTKKLMCVELSKGQMIGDVRLATNCKYPVDFVGRTGGIIITPEEVVEAAKKALEVK